MHHAIPVFATGALALVCGMALAGVDPADRAPMEIQSVSDEPPVVPPTPDPSPDPCRAVVEHVDHLVARAARPRKPTSPDDRADPCVGDPVRADLSRCHLAAKTPAELADCHLGNLDAPARRVHAELAEHLAADDGDRVDPERLAATTAALVDEMGGDGEQAAQMVREALAGLKDDDAGR